MWGLRGVTESRDGRFKGRRFKFRLDISHSIDRALLDRHFLSRQLLEPIDFWLEEGTLSSLLSFFELQESVSEGLLFEKVQFIFEGECAILIEVIGYTLPWQVSRCLLEPGLYTAERLFLGFCLVAEVQRPSSPRSENFPNHSYLAVLVRARPWIV